MRNRKILSFIFGITGLLVLVLVLVLVLGAGGCRLAKDDGLDNGADRLIGIFITTEYLDLFDFDRYLEDNISAIIKKGREITARDQGKYGGRIYAVLKEVEETDGNSGRVIKHSEYVFENLKGIPFYNFTIEEPEGTCYSSLSTSSAVSDVFQKIGDSTELEGTIYVAPGGLKTFYANPVFQSAGGDVYLEAGTGLHGGLSSGEEYSQTLEEKHTVTENSEKMEKGFKVTVKFAAKSPAFNLNLIEMGADHIPLSRRQYAIGDLPGKIEVDPETAYLLVETRGDPSPIGEQITRELIASGEEYLTVYIANDEGICEGEAISLEWTTH